MSDLTPTERALFQELIAASRILARTCTIAGTTLSEEFEGMVSEPLSNLEAVLVRCPEAVALTWNGEFHIEDCDEERYTPDLQGLPDEIRTGRYGSAVKLTHRPTGESVKVEQSADYETNWARAQRALRQRVERVARAERVDPLNS